MPGALTSSGTRIMSSSKPWCFNLKVIVTSKKTTVEKVLLFHKGRGSQRGGFDGEALRKVVAVLEDCR